MSFIYTLKLRDGYYYVGKTSDVQRRFEEHRNGEQGQGAAWTRVHPPVTIEAQYRVPTSKTSGLEEDKTVKELMIKHGIDKVRGGAYSSVDLTEAQINSLRLELRHNANACLRCGRIGHMSKNCYARTDSEGKAIQKRTKLEQTGSQIQESGYRKRNQTNDNMQNHCARTTSQRERPAAKLLKTSSRDHHHRCERCGRDNHTAEKCYAKKDANGKSIDESKTEYYASIAHRRKDANKAKSYRSGCRRCGRSTHNDNSCYATTDINGDFLGDSSDDAEEEDYVRRKSQPSCRRCGRDSHTAKKCYATTDINGGFLGDSSDDGEEDLLFARQIW